MSGDAVSEIHTPGQRCLGPVRAISQSCQKAANSARGNRYCERNREEVARSTAKAGSRLDPFHSESAS